MSVELAMSPASSPIAVPIWPPSIAPPSCRIIGANALSPPIPDSMARISAGHVAVELGGVDGHHGAHRVDRLGGDRVA